MIPRSDDRIGFAHNLEDMAFLTLKLNPELGGSVS
jgi:hypothetical protein